MVKLNCEKEEKKMKKIIDGRRYDTDTAKKLVNWDNGLPINAFSYTEETLYQKRTGEYFLYGESGAAGRYCRRRSSHCSTH